ncbi:5-formyltetrahydrofolate cyclo-ligase [Dichomitus squalens]|uniref:5-formyltetrahydrofolate cyclo-ligase n=1 Tax=Dichomitus squalens TaxID=114155 RepID=A0A4Q9NHA9_9APHY|nr:5-formyltetrahydrofolate cyclo-ligase [Dichomitus squalens]TBU52366.1 5-formyltetrahydrofolate cyclo-ligase [Dichomitus squalens]
MAAAASTTLRQQKTALRKSMRVLLANLSNDEIQAQSRAITNTLLALPEFQQSRNVSCFLSMPSGEVDTSAVVSTILSTGKNLFVPKTTDKAQGIMEFYQIFDEGDLRALPRGLWGIREPDDAYNGRQRPTASTGGAEPLDLIVMPGIAFDRSLSRLGYGKGYYDRFLASYAATLRARQQLRPKLVALAFREQILEAGQVPVGETDWKVDAIVGPDGIVRS